jgi:O-antigen ligase
MYSSLAKIQQRLASCSFTKALPVIALAAMLTLPFWSLNGHRWIIHTYSLVLFPLLVSLFLNAEQAWLILKTSALTQIILVFVFYLSISTLWNDGTHDDYAKRGLFLAIFILGLASSKLTKTAMINTITLGVVSCACYILYVLFFEPDKNRFSGINALFNPLLTGNLFAAFCCLGFFALVIDASRKTRITLLAGLLIIAYGVLETGTRSSLLAISAFLIGFVLLNLKGRNRLWAVALVTTLAALVFLFWQEEILSRGQSYRPYVWQYSFNAALDQWLLGTGIGSDLIRIPKPDHPTKYWSDTHNIFLGYFYYGGIVALALWLGVIFVAMISALSKPLKNTSTKTLLLVFLASLATYSFDGGHLLSRSQYSWIGLWLPLTLLIKFSVEAKAMSRSDI